MRFSLPGQGQIRIGLKTPDLVAAEAKAIWQAKHNVLPGKMSFDKLSKDFLASVAPSENSTDRHVRAYKSVITRYLAPFFGGITVTSLTAPRRCITPLLITLNDGADLVRKGVTHSFFFNLTRRH